MHETKLAWATNRINEATRERDELSMKIEELSDLIVELTTCLNQGENLILSVQGVCTFRASDIRILLQQLQETRRNQPAATSPTLSTSPHEPTGPRGPVHPSVVRREGEDLPLAPISVEPPRPPTPITPVDQGFCEPLSHPCCSPKRLDLPYNGRNSSAASISSRSESTLVRKLILKRMADLNKITAKPVDDSTDLKKIKLLLTRTVPKVEKAVRELKNTLQQYSRLCALTTWTT